MRLYDYESTESIMGTASQYCLRWNNHQTNLLSAFDLLLRQESFTDVTLACEEGVTLHAHRLVLAACSTYFSSLFSSTSPSQHPIVVLKDVRATEMRALLNYMYRGEVNVEQGHLKGLLKVAEGLRVKGLVEDLASDTQTHPLPLITTNSSHSHHAVMPPSQRNTPLNSGSRSVSPSITPVDLHITPTSNEGWEPELPYTKNARRHFCSPSTSPSKRSRPDSRDSQVHQRVVSPPPHPFFPHHFQHHPSFNQHPRIPSIHLDPKDLRSVREAYERDRIDRPPRPSSDDIRHRRLSPLPLTQHVGSLHTSRADSPPNKRSRQILGEPIISPTPILRTALAHTRSFQSDVSSLVSLANSIIPIPSLLPARPQPIPTHEEIRRVHEQRELHEQSYALLHPKKSEPLSDDDSRQHSDVSREDEAHEKLNNGPLLSDFSNYHLDPSNTSHFSNFVSYVPTPKPEWKRYKQYTKTDLMEAIEAVKKGMTALQASRKYKVPSRTLYDKIKKMGINTIPRRLPTKRSSTTDIEVNDSSALSLISQGHPMSSIDQRPSPGEYYSERPLSRECTDVPLHLSSLQLHPSLTPKEEKMDRSEDLSVSPVSPQEDSPVEASTRGSFSLVGRKMFPEEEEEEEEATPLDLTDTEGIISTRTQIEERA